MSVILLGSVDFWITKNVSGRFLVGLRWWNEVKKDGKEVWIFESKNEKMEATADKSIFWTSLYVNGGGWAILFLFKLITLSITNAIIAFTMLIFAGVNLYGFFKCSKEQQGRLKKFGTKNLELKLFLIWLNKEFKISEINCDNLIIFKYILLIYYLYIIKIKNLKILLKIIYMNY